MSWHRSYLIVVALAAITLPHCIPASTSKHKKLFEIINERLTEENSRQFSAGFCNASIPLNDHLYQLIGWCTKLGLGKRCLSHGVAACLFKKYIDSGLTFDVADGVTSDQLSKRLQIFSENLRTVVAHIESHLAGKSPLARGIKGAARFGITKFMHPSPDEFRDRYLSIKILDANVMKSVNTDNSFNVKKLRKRRSASSMMSSAQGVMTFQARPDRVDWRDAGAVTAVKNQGACGSCWAFAVTEVAESQFASKSNQPLTELSVQQVTDCTAGSAGCGGGDICQTARYYSSTMSNRIVQDNLYPYVGKSQPCRQITGGYQIATTNVQCRNLVNNEDALLDHLWRFGTAAVAVDAQMWQYYIDGVILHNCGTQVNHAVQLVGFDLVSGPAPFYLVRNSWGSDWGMAGYLQIGQGQNLCGLAQQVVTFGVTGAF